MTNPSPERNARRDVVQPSEFNDMMSRATAQSREFNRLRTQALICLLRFTGKRRGEVTRLELSDFKRGDDILNVTFELLKKRKGSVMSRRVVKGLPLSDPLTAPIIEYLDHLETLKPKPRFFLPRTHVTFGVGWTYEPEEHISGRQVLNLFRQVSDMAWPHLMRETVGAEIVKADPTIIGVFKVKQRLDHEDIKTSMRYLERYAVDVIRRETEE